MKELAKKYPCLDLNRVGVFWRFGRRAECHGSLLWHNDFYKAAVADCGCHDNRMDKIWWNEQWMGTVLNLAITIRRILMSTNAHLLQGKLMLVVGELDRNVDPASTTQVVAKLIEANKDFDFLLMSGADHGACESPMVAENAWSFLRPISALVLKDSQTLTLVIVQAGQCKRSVYPFSSTACHWR